MHLYIIRPRSYLKFTLDKRSLKHSYSLATFSHIGKFAQPIANDYDYDYNTGKGTACKPDQYTQ